MDTFPTRYRTNTKSDVLRLAAESGLVVVRVERIEGRPDYLRMAWPMYLIGTLYERLVNSTRLLKPYRILLVVTMRKPL